MPPTGPNANQLLDHLVVLHGELSPELAHLYVTLDLPHGEGEWRLAGSVYGPASTLTRTLPARVPLSGMEPGPTLAARALVPDPCFWGPASPYLYDVDVQLYRGQQCVASITRTFGMRMLGTLGQQLLLEAQPWTLLGVADAPHRRDPWPQWRRLAPARVITDPNDEDCNAASRHGVLLVAEVTAQTTTTLASEIRRLARHAAVALLVVRHRQAIATDPHSMAPNLLVADYFTRDEPVQPAPWADVAVCDADHAAPLPLRLADCEIPVVVRKCPSQADALESAADRCAAWHKELTTVGDFAGCLV